ncbi:uncharacterized protein si:ch211-14c7.2 [Conger conger]|uniref:uncharacterized protein si:ch211-14c7.2 n=1 Tax=Conger conger TaxID=82655 RepID=UPI002A5A6D17|nr:uncharacterized protein si:ch211-14c7.2 [Conger conger]
MSSLRCAEPIDATAMLQENNNNNYSCLERACESREVLQERERGVLPFAKILEMGSFPELGDITRRAPVRGFRAWAMSSVCARSRRRAALPPANPAPFLKKPDATEKHAAGEGRPQAGRLAPGGPGVGLGLQLDTGSWNRCRGSRQGTLGALVTVATLTASERGGQTQTQCFLLQAKGQSYLCTAGRHRAPPPRLFAKLTPAPAAHGLGEAASSDKPRDSRKANKQREGKDKPRPVRKWRTSCEVAFSVKERVPWDSGDREFPAPGASQESRSKLASQSSAQDMQTSKQESRDAEASRTAKTCTQCSEERGRSAIGLGRRVEDSVCSNGSVEEEEMTSPMSGSAVFRLDPDPTNAETGCSPTHQEGPISAGMQDGLQPKSSSQKSGHFQDLPEDNWPCLGAGSKSQVPGASEANLAVDAEALKETGSPPDKDNESNLAGDNLQCTEGVRGRLPCGDVGTKNPQSGSCEDDGLASSTVQWAHLAAGSDGDPGSSAEAEDTPEQLRQSTLSEGGRGEVVGHEARPLDDTENEEGVWTTTNGHPPEYVEFSSETRAGVSGTGGSGLSDVWGGGHHRGWDGPEAGAKIRDPILQPDNSLSRGLGSAATDAHAPPNPAPPGAMATALSSLEGRRDGALLGDPQRQDWEGGMVASGERFPDVEQEGDDDFGLFIQAGEQPSWDDGFADFQQVPYGTCESAADPVRESEPARWTLDKPSHQSEDTWTAFSLAGSIALDPGLGERQHKQPDGQWWPQKATEECCVMRAPFDVSQVFQETFSSMPSSYPNPTPVRSLRQHLRGLSCEDSTVGDSGSLLDGLQDVNRIIGLKYKWAESHSQKLLLQSLHVDVNNKGHVTSSRANDSPSASLPSFSQHTSPMGNGKAKLSYDINKNIFA